MSLHGSINGIVTEIFSQAYDNSNSKKLYDGIVTLNGAGTIWHNEGVNYEEHSGLLRWYCK